jgi:glutamyl-tRNA synthetase
MVDFFEEMPEYDTAIFAHKKMKTNEETSLAVLKEVLPLLEAHDDYTNDSLFALLSDYIKSHEYKNGYVLWPVRIAVCGKEMTPCGATELMEVIGKDETIARIKKSIALLEK